MLPDVHSAPAQQQPDWQDLSLVQQVRGNLSRMSPLVRLADLLTLRAQLARVAAGEAHVLQCGDCAENPEDRTRGDVVRKAALLDVLAGTMRMRTHKPVLRVGRIAGQFSKPRSASTEQVGDTVLPVYRGHMVNRPEPTAERRRPDPSHILSCYAAAAEIMGHLGWQASVQSRVDSPLWSSHEALLLDYEVPLLRTSEGQTWLSSTHWPWIGERTRQVDGAHVALLAGVVNPVACKVGPSMTTQEIRTLCERLDPNREPGRLTFIVRMGARTVADRLPPLLEAVRAIGHPVIWLCDPMHANTVMTPDGLKTRHLDTVIREVQDFQFAVRAAGGVAGGLHLETTADEVTECVGGEISVSRVADKYTTLCDPRLNPAQAIAVVSAWQG